MSNLEKKGGEEEIFNKELASHLKEFKKLKTELEKLQNELIKGSSKELLAKFQTLEKKLNELKEKIEFWGKDNESLVLNRLKGELVAARKKMMKTVAREVQKFFQQKNNGPMAKIVTDTILEDDFKVYDIEGEGGEFFQRIDKNSKVRNFYAPAFLDADFLDQGLQSPEFLSGNVEIFNFSNPKLRVEYLRWQKNQTNPDGHYRGDSAADFLFSDKGEEYYLPGIDAFLYVLYLISEIDKGSISYSPLLNKIKDEARVVALSHKMEKVVLKLVFPGCAIFNHGGEWCFPVILWGQDGNNFSVDFIPILDMVDASYFFVLFKK